MTFPRPCRGSRVAVAAIHNRFGAPESGAEDMTAMSDRENSAAPDYFQDHFTTLPMSYTTREMLDGLASAKPLTPLDPKLRTLPDVHRSGKDADAAGAPRHIITNQQEAAIKLETPCRNYGVINPL